MTSVSGRPIPGDHDTPTDLDREQALTLWRAMLPTWTTPGARFRDPAALVAALGNAVACRLVADRLTARRAGVHHA